MRRADVVARRVAFALVTIVMAISLNFVLFRAVPGDAVTALQCGQCSAEFRASQRHALGLDRPLPEQYWIYLSGLAYGDLGLSLDSRRPVLEEIGPPLLNSVPVMALSLVVAVALGVGTGVLAAWRRGSAVDRGTTWTALVCHALPPQWLGLLMVLFVAGWLGVPAAGAVDPMLGVLGDASTWEVVGDRLRHMILPVSTLALVIFGEFTMISRSSMLETLGEDYVLTARAMGMRDRRIVWRHAFRNAMLPQVTAVAMSIGFIAGGAITIEYVFSYPGVGLRAVHAIDQRDWPVLQGIFLVVTVTVILSNLAADLLYAALDPRVTA